MKLSDFELMTTQSPNGVQTVLEFGKYQLSIICNEVSYGNKQGLYEIAVFDDVDQIELPGITNNGDTVKGWLSEPEVDAIIKKMVVISGAEPVQI